MAMSLRTAAFSRVVPVARKSFRNVAGHNFFCFAFHERLSSRNAKQNNYIGVGSENAVIHFGYRCALKSALATITGLELTPAGLTKTVIIQPISLPPSPPRVIRSDFDPRAFPEEVDFG